MENKDIPDPSYMRESMKYVELIGRLLFSLIFLKTVTFHFTSAAVDYATSKGVPFAGILVPLSGIMAIAGAISIILGYKTKAGAWLIVLFLFPVTLFMHAFWKETDPMQVQMQMTSFMKNTSMFGAALIISYFGAGPLSLDFRMKRKIN